MRVLVIEDDEAISASLSEALARAGHCVSTALDGATGDSIVRASTYDAVLVDLGLPRTDGLSLLRSWRRGGLALAVVIVSARGSWHDRVLGFDAGADDYVSKPFDTGELLRRLEASVARYRGRSWRLTP